MKSKINFLLAVLLLSLGYNQIYAQELISSAGGYYEGNNLSLSWSLGEPVTETFTGGGVILTQGFQQPYSFYLQQILNIPAGWSGVSAYLDPMNKGVEGIFTPYVSDLVILASMTKFYYPAENINTIGNWDYHSGYKIKADNEFDVTFTGTRISNPSVDFAAGWNLIPVLSLCEVPVADVFASFPGLTIVKQVAGSLIYWPAYNINTLQSLVPGKAYFVAAGNAGTITFPGCTKSSSTKWQDEKPVNLTHWNAPHYTALSHAIAFPAEVLVNSGIKTGDVIGVFTPEGLCAGSIQVAGLNSNVALVSFSNDETTSIKDGFEAGEMLQFKVFRPNDNFEMPLNVEFEPAMPNQRLFAGNGLSAVKSATVGLPDWENTDEIDVEIYPNPSHGIFSIAMSYWPEKLKIELMDVNGQLIREFEPANFPVRGTYQFNMSELPKGVYFVRLTATGFMEMKKIVIN